MNKQRYQFTGEVKHQVNAFKNHLKSQSLDESTTQQKTNYAGYFLKWVEGEHMNATDVRYNDLLEFIDYCKGDAMTKTHINRVMASLRDYYTFLKTIDPTRINPAAHLILKGSRKKVVSGIIDQKELESLYQSYPTNTLREKRNRVMLGLIIFEGVHTQELSKLESTHVALKEGRITIPGSRIRNSRTLELKPFQILEMHEYLTEIQPRILEEIPNPKPRRKPQNINQTRINDQLFISINGSEHIKNTLLHLFRDVRKLNPNITSAQQIRQSTITHWLKIHNLRQVQYMAGHRWVSSTERYQANNLEDLQTRLDKYHPLGGIT